MADERQVLDALHTRYGKMFAGARRYAVAEQVKSHPWQATRIVDFIAVDGWPSSGCAIHGHEVKVSRSDWLAELRAPEKAAAFTPYVDYWWLVVPDTSIVRGDELPAGWGLMVLHGDTTRVKKPAMHLPALPMPQPMLAALLRATAKTAVRQDHRALAPLLAREVVSTDG